MRKLSVKILITAAWLLAGTLFAAEVSAQRMPERRFVRKGNRQYDRSNFESSILRYMQALERDSTSFEAVYDLGNALFRAERFDTAEQMLTRAAADTTRTDAERAEAFFNLGDVQFRQQNLQGALECFKNSLRLNPDDMEAKYNYAYVKKLLEDQQQQQQQNDDNNKDNQDNQDNKDNQNDNRNDDNQNGDGEQEQQPDNGDDRNDDGSGERPQGSISPEQLEAMLDAIQAQEDKTQEKVKEKQGVIIRGKKNW